jgi:toxin FitB
VRIVLDTDVASGLIKGALSPAMLAAIAPHQAALSFVTVGELARWIHARDLGQRRRRAVEAFFAAHPVGHSGWS